MRVRVSGIFVKLKIMYNLNSHFKMNSPKAKHLQENVPFCCRGE